jgi:hypothetical protein
MQDIQYKIIMNSTAKVVIPNKEWLIKFNDKKVGTIAKNKKGYTFLRKGQSVTLKDLAEVKSQFGIGLFEEGKKKQQTDSQETKSFFIYDYPCTSKPYGPVFNVKKKLPLYAKSAKSKSQYCAGYYIIKFRKGWVKSFCPKLITLERYPYHGPFKTELEMRDQLNIVNKS